MTTEAVFHTPLYVMVPRKRKADKKVFINMNTYRNLHYMTNNEAKRIYRDKMLPFLIGKRFKTPVEITYQLFKPTRRSMDKMNVASVASKYFLDAVTHFKCWEDDNDIIVKTETLLPTEIDRNNPRMEITIKSI